MSARERYAATAARLELPVAQVKRVVEAWFADALNAVRAGVVVRVPKVGAFRKSVIKARRVRAPNGRVGEVPEVVTIRFRAASAAKRRLK